MKLVGARAMTPTTVHQHADGMADGTLDLTCSACSLSLYARCVGICCSLARS